MMEDCTTNELLEFGGVFYTTIFFASKKMCPGDDRDKSQIRTE